MILIKNDFKSVSFPIFFVFEKDVTTPLLCIRMFHPPWTLLQKILRIGGLICFLRC